MVKWVRGKNPINRAGTPHVRAYLIGGIGLVAASVFDLSNVRGESGGSQRISSPAESVSVAAGDGRRHSPRWRLRDGDKIEANLVGYGVDRWIVEGRRGQVWVNHRRFTDLPSIARQVILHVVSNRDTVDLQNRADLAEYVSDRGGGPIEYFVSGVRLQLSSGDVVTVPLEMLHPADARNLQRDFNRWRAAPAREAPSDNHRHTDRNRHVDPEPLTRSEREYWDHARAAIPYLQLQLLAAAAGVTDIWEVTIYPPHPFGYPVVVIVPARNSFAAQRRALQQYPNGYIGETRKLND